MVTTKSHADLLLEFADLEDSDDEIWIDLEDIFEVAAMAPQPVVPVREDTEPVAFFAAHEPGDDSSPSRQSGPVQGPRGSLIEEETKPVPPPEP